MSRKALIAANWKMFKTPVEAKAFVDAFLPLVAGTRATRSPCSLAGPAAHGDCRRQGLERRGGGAEHPLCRGGRLHRRDLAEPACGRRRNAHPDWPLGAPPVLCRDRRNRQQEAARGVEARRCSGGLRGEVLAEREAGKTADVLKTQIAGASRASRPRPRRLS